tara:strand:+ start:692 stop:2050 length:1359 start_codon:yes stop_codon:yes gene_type:complete
MFSRTVATLAIAVVASAKNLRFNEDIINVDSNTNFGDESRKLVYNGLYSGDIPGTIPNLVNTATTSVDSIQTNDGEVVKPTDLPSFCDTIPKLNDAASDTEISAVCNTCSDIPEGSALKKSFQTTIPQGTLNGVISIIGLVCGTVDNTTIVAFDFGQISTTLIQQRKQVGTHCTCSFGGCGSLIHHGCHNVPDYANCDDTLEQLEDVSDYLQFNLRPSFAPPAKIQEINGTKNLNKYMGFISDNADKIIKKDMKHAGPFQKIMNDYKKYGQEYDAISFKGLDSDNKNKMIDEIFNDKMFCTDDTKICNETVKTIHDMAKDGSFTNKKLNHDDVNVFECISKSDTNRIYYSHMITTVYDIKSEKVNFYIGQMIIDEKNKIDNIIPGYMCNMFAFDTKKNMVSHNLSPKTVIVLDSIPGDVHIKKTDDVYTDYAHALDFGKIISSIQYEMEIQN